MLIVGQIRVGNNVSINSNVQPGAADHGKIVIGDNALIGPNTALRASNHKFGRIDVPIRKKGHSGDQYLLKMMYGLVLMLLFFPR